MASETSVSSVVQESGGTVGIEDLRERLGRLEDVLASAAAMDLNVRLNTAYDDDLASAENAIDVLLEDFTSLLAQRSAVEEELKEKLETIQKQQEAINELSTPVIKVWENLLVLPIIGTLDSQRTQRMMETLLQEITTTGCRFAILDITGVAVVDTMVANHLIKTITAAGLMGAECILSGISPHVAQTLVHLGIDLREVKTKAKMMEAVKYAISANGQKIVQRPSEAGDPRPEAPTVSSLQPKD